MSYSSEDWRLATVNLMKKTSKREIEWELSSLLKADPGAEVDRSFSCDLKEKTYVVSSLRRKQYIDETEYYWETYYDLSVFAKVHYAPTKIATAPQGLNVVENLFATVEASYAYSQGALGDLLG